jgi:hypothetical protein
VIPSRTWTITPGRARHRSQDGRQDRDDQAAAPALSAPALGYLSSSKFEPKRLPVVALRRILGQVALKKRASANSAERAAWSVNGLLFVSNYGEGDERQISFAHFSQAEAKQDLPTLKVLGWDNLDTALHLDAVAKELTENLAWPDDGATLRVGVTAGAPFSRYATARWLPPQKSSRSAWQNWPAPSVTASAPR